MFYSRFDFILHSSKSVAFDWFFGLVLKIITFIVHLKVICCLHHTALFCAERVLFMFRSWIDVWDLLSQECRDEVWCNVV